jgi:tetratricopeptide (TPR) repeat protein
MKISLYGENHPDIVDLYNIIANTYSKCDNYHQALESLNKSLSINIYLLGENHIDIEIQISEFCNNHSDVADSYNLIGDIHIIINEQQKGLEYLEKSLEIRISLYGKNIKL